MNRAKRRELAARVRKSTPRRYRKYYICPDGSIRRHPAARALEARRGSD